MNDTPDRNVQKLERQITILKRILLLGIIIVIIGFSIMIALLYRLDQLQNELDELGPESDEIPLSEQQRRLKELDNEIASSWLYNIISTIFIMAGFTLISIGNRYKKLEKLLKSYLDSSEEGKKLSFIVEEDANLSKQMGGLSNKLGLIGPIKARKLISQNLESIPLATKIIFGVLFIILTLIVTFLTIRLIGGFFFYSYLQTTTILCLVIFISLFMFGYISQLVIIKKYNLKSLERL